MATTKYVIGVDFGTLSGRAVLVEASSGKLVAQKEQPYSRSARPRAWDGVSLGDGWAIQDPGDYLWVLEAMIPELLCEGGVSGESVAALGCDATSCTILPTTADGTPLCRAKDYCRRPHAYVKLWKHHSASNQAWRIEEYIKGTYPTMLDYYGGKVSAQWMLPKVLQIVEEDPEIYQDCSLILEVTDWIPFQLTGQLRRNTCCAGFKGFWHPDRGYPSCEFFAGLDKHLEDLVSVKLRGAMAAPWEAVGYLTAEWAERLGLTTSTVVSSGIIDAHAGVLGSGISSTGQLAMILGTSACHILLSHEKVPISGICGSCKEGILPGFYAYEAGQACVGDMLDWFVRSNIPAVYDIAAEKENITKHQLLTLEAEKLQPGESGLLALDWWNGQRTPLVNDQLTGVMLGMTLHTTAAEQYRALLESAAYGSKLILERFESHGIAVPEVIACGGIAKKNSLLMQIFADVLNRPVKVAASNQSPALGAAILAASAAGIFKSPAQAVNVMTRPGEAKYMPRPDAVKVYRSLYQKYCELTSYFGSSDLMRDLRACRMAGRARNSV